MKSVILSVGTSLVTPALKSRVASAEDHQEREMTCRLAQALFTILMAIALLSLGQSTRKLSVKSWEYFSSAHNRQIHQHTQGYQVRSERRGFYCQEKFQILDNHEQEQRVVDDPVDVDLLLVCWVFSLLSHRPKTQPSVRLRVLHLQGLSDYPQ